MENFKNTTFGVEIEFTGITREKAAATIASVLGQCVRHVGGAYDSYEAYDRSMRTWAVVSDSSVALGPTSCELVTPVLSYDSDMETLQQIVRALRKAGGRVTPTCGLHIHLDGSRQTVRSLKNWAAIVASKNDLLYDAIEVKADRLRYCQKIDETLVAAFSKARTMDELKDAWYETYPCCYRRSWEHYHESRYHFLNLHSFFSGRYNTIELRGFNSTLHAGEVRSYVVLALALNAQALSQKTARAAKPQIENKKFAMRTYLNRLGLIGSEYAACREHLTKKLTGCAAWRFGSPA